MDDDGHEREKEEQVVFQKDITTILISDVHKTFFSLLGLLRENIPLKKIGKKGGKLSESQHVKM